MTDQIDLFNAPSADVAPADFDFESIPTSATVPIPKGIYDDLATLSRHCNNCQRCGLAAGRTHVVVSRGNPQAPIMIVGEGPRTTRGRAGIAFCR